MKRRNILLISPVPTHPSTAGNRTRVDGLLSSLRGLGHDVYFLHVQNEAGDVEDMRRRWGERFSSIAYTPPASVVERIKRRLRSLLDAEARYVYSIDAWYDPTLGSTLRELHARFNFDTVIVEYVFFSKALECFGDEVLKIIDTHDAFTNRHEQYLQHGQQPQWYSTTAKEEGRGFDRADVVIAIQDKERQLFSQLTRKRVITVGHIVALREPESGLAKPGRMLFVASDNPINVDGIQHFIDEAWPRVRDRLAHAELAIAGSVCKAIPDAPGIAKLGRLDDLRPAYDAAALVINPVRFNTGLSIKNLEALGYAKPLVTATVSADGIRDGIGTAFLTADHPEEYARAVIQVLTHDDTAQRLARGAYDYAVRCNRNTIQQLENLLV